MYSITPSVVSLLFVSTLGLAAPPPYHLYPRQGTTTALSQTVIDSFKPSTHFAAAAYCSSATTKTWTCGQHCDAVPGFETSLVGGDGADTPLFFVGFDPNSNSVVVGHQGTDPSKVKSLLVDTDFVLQPMDSKIFPGLPSGIETHGGFQEAHARSASQILQAVQSELAARNTNNVLVVGHSLGGALALLDCVFLKLKLPSTIQLKGITFGMPRVGNQQFADYIDAHISLNRITNHKDIVPILPGRFLGFRHPSGEAHIATKDAVMRSCSGQENTGSLCSDGDAKNILVASIPDHFGPYSGIMIRC